MKYFTLIILLIASCTGAQIKNKNNHFVKLSYFIDKSESSKEFQELLDQLNLQKDIQKGEKSYNSQDGAINFVMSDGKIKYIVINYLKNQSIPQTIELLMQKGIQLGSKLQGLLNYKKAMFFCKNNNIPIYRHNNSTIKDGKGFEYISKKYIYRIVYDNRIVPKFSQVFLKERGKLIMPPDTITAICSGIIALIALIYSLVAGRRDTKHNEKVLNATIKHNRLSVKPILNFRVTQKGGVLSQVILENNGLGPAIITSYQVFFKGKEFVNFTSKDSDLNIFYNLIGIQQHQYKYCECSLPKPALSPQNENVTLFFFKDTLNSVIKTAIKFNQKDIKLKIEYEDIYGNAMEPYSITTP